MGYENPGDHKTDTEVSECLIHIKIWIISPNEF